MEASSGNRPKVIWLTGLSGAGKSTIADALLIHLQQCGIRAARLDGDDLRTGLNSDLGFSLQDRTENLRRAAHVARLFANLGHTTICSFITPLEEDRHRVRDILGPLYFEVYVQTSLAECERRDPKGLYKRARTGELKQFTGISAAFDEPSESAMVIDTEKLSVSEAVLLLAKTICANR